MKCTTPVSMRRSRILTENLKISDVRWYMTRAPDIRRHRRHRRRRRRPRRCCRNTRMKKCIKPRGVKRKRSRLFTSCITLSSATREGKNAYALSLSSSLPLFLSPSLAPLTAKPTTPHRPISRGGGILAVICVKLRGRIFSCTF